MNRVKFLSIIRVALMLMLCLFVSQQAFSAAELYKVIAEKAVVYRDTTAKAKKLGKLPLDREIYVFEISGNRAKIRYNKQWAYVNVNDIAYTPKGWYEVTAKSLPVYKEKGSKKPITSLTKGKLVNISGLDETKQFVHIYYDNGKSGYVAFSGIQPLQPLPVRYEVITTSPKYKKPDVNAEVEKYSDKTVINFQCGDIILVHQYDFRNEKWVEDYKNYIQLKNLKALPDSITADKLEEIELSSERRHAQRETSKSISGTMPWIILILTVLSLYLSSLISEHKLTIRMIAIYLLAILSSILMNSNPDLPNAFQTGLFDKNFWRVFGIVLVAAIVVGCITWLIVRCFRDIKDRENTFLAILSVAFPAIVMVVASFYLIIWMIPIIIPLGIILFMAAGSGGDSSSSSKKKGEVPRLGGGVHCSNCYLRTGNYCKGCGEYIGSPDSMTCDNWNSNAGTDTKWL